MWTVEPTKEELNQKLSTATRSMEHMNSLLHETEATNAVLMEQITVCTSAQAQRTDITGSHLLYKKHCNFFINLNYIHFTIICNICFNVNMKNLISYFGQTEFLFVV